MFCERLEELLCDELRNKKASELVVVRTVVAGEEIGTVCRIDTEVVVEVYNGELILLCDSIGVIYEIVKGCALALVIGS